MLTHEERVLAELITLRQRLPASRLSWHASKAQSGRTTLAASLVETGDLPQSEVEEWVGRAQSFSAQLTADRELPRTLGEFQLVREIGRGGAGVVYEAVQLSLDRRVAVKLLPAGLVRRSVSGVKVLQEARAVGRLRHPGIVTVFSAGEQQDFVYFAMEFVGGPSLARQVYQQAATPESAAAIVQQVALAIDHAHQAGFLHRDVKPENILLAPDGQPRVTDFGLVCELSHGEDVLPGQVLGTPAYMAPEQATGDVVGVRTDVYGLGSVLYAMLAGAPPYTGQFAAEVLEQLRKGPPLSLAQRVPTAPTRLVEICEKAMARTQEERHTSAREVANELDVFAATGKAVPTATGSRFRRPLAVWVLVLALALGMVAGATWLRDLHPVSNARKAPTLGLLRGQFILIPSPSNRASPAHLAPDGDRIIYATTESDGRQIVESIIGLEDSQRTSSGKAARLYGRRVQFSPNGDRIAIGSDGMLRLGSDTARVLPQGCREASWAPDGRQIACHAFHRRQLVVVDTVTGATRPLFTDRGLGQVIAWSPAGGHIALTVTHGGKTDLAIIPTHGGDLIELTNNEALEWSPAWAPDGKTLFFGSNRGGAPDVWRLAIDVETGAPRGDPEPVTRGIMPALFRLAAAHHRNRLLISPVPTESLGTVGFDSTVGQLTSVPRLDRRYLPVARYPHRSPQDGDLVFTASLDQDLRIEELASPDPLAWRLLTTSPAVDGAARWSPLGDLIAFHSNRSGSMEIWTVRPDGSDPRQRTALRDRDAMFPVWSPDGVQLAFHVRQGDAVMNSYVLLLTENELPTDPHELVPLPRPDAPFIPWSWSVDGEQLAGSSDGIVVYSTGDEEYRRYTDFGEAPIWIDGQQALLFVNGDQIQHLDLRTGEVSLVHSVAPTRLQPWLALSQSGNRLDYAVTAPDDRLILIDLDHKGNKSTE